MIIQTKYNIGDKVYFLIEENEYDFYLGEITSTTKIIKETTITYIETMIFTFQGLTISYGDDDHKHCLEKYVFATKEDAEQHLLKRRI